MCTDLITASGLRSLRTLPSTRVDRNGSSIAIRPCAASSSTACAQAASVGDRARIVEVDAAQHLSAVHPRGGGRRRGGARSSGRRVRTTAPARPPRLNDENTTLSSSAPSSSRSSRMSDGGEHAVDTGVGQRGAQPVEQVGAAVHRGRAGADAKGAAGGVVGGDDHQPAVTAHRRPGGARLPGARDGAADRRRAGR